MRAPDLLDDCYLHPPRPAQPRARTVAGLARRWEWRGGGQRIPGRQGGPGAEGWTPKPASRRWRPTGPGRRSLWRAVRALRRGADDGAFRDGRVCRHTATRADHQWPRDAVVEVDPSGNRPFQVVASRGNGSFPSGHTSASFATATVIQRRWGWRAGLPAYALASYVGASRLHDNHYLSDVAFGAGLGIAAGLAINQSSWRVAVLPAVGHGRAGVVIDITLGGPAGH